MFFPSLCEPRNMHCCCNRKFSPSLKGFTSPHSSFTEEYMYRYSFLLLPDFSSAFAFTSQLLLVKTSIVAMLCAERTFGAPCLQWSYVKINSSLVATFPLSVLLLFLPNNVKPQSCTIHYHASCISNNDLENRLKIICSFYASFSR